MKSNENNIQYWKGLNDLSDNPEHEALKKKEFAEPIPLDAFVESIGLKKVTPRRDFLKTMGFGLGAVSLAACSKAPVHKAIPYLIKPDEITPGIPNYYTSTFDSYSILVKTREGRPIKIEGNPKCPITKGGVDAPGQASVLGLYDSAKLKAPMVEGNDVTWADLDNYVSDKLIEAKKNNRAIRIISNSINSPSTKKVIGDFMEVYPTSSWIQYEPVSYSALNQSNKNSFAKEVIPSYHFENADVIVGVNCDFLGAWLSPVEFTLQYTSKRGNRSLEEKKMSRHFQFETGMSLTGSNADFRYAIKPSLEGPILMALYNEIATLMGEATLAISSSFVLPLAGIKKAAKALMEAKNNALVVSGSNDVSIQILTNSINSILGSYGKTIDLENYSLQRSSNDAEFLGFLKELEKGIIDVVLFYGVNPIYDFAENSRLAMALKKAKLRVSFSDKMDETASLCDAVAIDQHFLEAWNDVQAKANLVAIQQPAINPIFDSRTGQQNFINWAFLGSNGSKMAVVLPASGATNQTSMPVDSAKKGSTATAASTPTPQNPVIWADYLKDHWEKVLFPKFGLAGNFTENWEHLLREGFVISQSEMVEFNNFEKDLGPVVQTIQANAQANSGDFEVNLYQSVALRDGRFSNNPWLLELPDPVTKVTWDNYIAIGMKTAQEHGLIDGDELKVSINGKTEMFHVLIQPGQAYGTGSIALGYGRTKVGKAGNNVGQNAYPFVNLSNGTFQYHNKATLEKGARGFEFARTQDHDTIEGRSMTKETILSEYLKNPYAGSGRSDSEEEEKANAWDDFPKKGHHWGMSIDLNACTGCNACIVACNAENNVAVVGREEVHRRREMHWLRIDRYYSFNDEDGKAHTKESDLKGLAREGKLANLENVSVFYQPMLCQQCDHAPCETVCPVLATMHSSEGLNMQIYNRCFGTRYCANNCPYKVRRFNWFKYFDNDQFDYQMNDDLGKMVLNPDVTVRSRGVMEKCTFCVQRIQAGKLEAKIAGVPLEDGQIQTACQQTCPANAIVFGDINNPNAEVTKLLKNERTYYVLDELGVRPGIGYMTKVRNRDHVFLEAKPESL